MNHTADAAQGGGGGGAGGGSSGGVSAHRGREKGAGGAMAVACVNKQTSALEFGKGRSAWNRFPQAERFKEETE